MPCHVARLNAKTPARLFRRSTRRMVYSGSVNLADRLSSDTKHRNGGRRDSFPDCREPYVKESAIPNKR